MNLAIELPNSLVDALQAQAQGISAGDYISRVLEQTLASEIQRANAQQPFETGYGMWARYDPPISLAEVII